MFYLCSLLVIFLSQTLTTCVFIPGPIVKVARCRAHCLEETLSYKNRDDFTACRRKNSCLKCWEMCEKLLLSYPVWSDMCRKKSKCRKGCRKACQFSKNVPDVIQSNQKWNISKPIALRYHETGRLGITWEAPKSQTKLQERLTFVYILFVKDALRRDIEWEQILQTTSTDLELSQDDIPIIPEFLLLVVTKNGTLANVQFNITMSPVNKVLRNQPVQGFSDSKLNVTVTSTINETKSDGSLDAIIEWNHPPNLTQLKNLDYTVTWFLNECGIYEDSPRCSIPADYWYKTVIIANTSIKPSLRIKNLIYNAEYDVQVEYGNGKAWDGTAKFYTLFCPDLDLKTHKYCPSYKRQKDTKDSQRDNGTQDINKDGRTDVDGPDLSFLSWKLKVTSMFYDNTTDTVIVNFNWSVPFNQSTVELCSLKWRITDYTDGIAVHVQNCTNTQLKLRPYDMYEIWAIAEYRNIMGDLKDSKSDVLELNTSGVRNMSPFPRPQTLVHRKAHFKTLDGIIIGVTVVLSIVMLGLIILFIYKKRQSFKDIIITKTAVAKSNSYKSNVGCKVDYSNQLLVMSDEWELDPRSIKFSSPIGQGAFGKVVTGYFEDKRVAIKLVRDSAPLSYKEDLLAEINLMKRIGTHPNIVSMIGACTLTEPIALIMEYIPYGNLQNFLKKCRLEGELQKRIGRPCEITYSIMDHSGGIDSGVITPADMLSFARQVAMAMEYLAEKKYVHRDLAARNILLDYNKVVKVCDFGLSRDIYNDNQYHKITSGKLPLKWMAIESLRDRIFTTPSDVWSFGILLWEIVTMGGSPYPSIALADLYTFLSNGYRMERPSNCSEELYIIMSQCWTENPADRLTFTEIRLQLEQLLSRDRNYLELDNIDIPMSTSESSSSTPKSDRDSSSLVIHRGAMTQPCISMQPCKTVQPKRVVIPQDPTTVNVCIEKSTEWLIRGHDDETAS